MATTIPIGLRMYAEERSNHYGMTFIICQGKSKHYTTKLAMATDGHLTWIEEPNIVAYCCPGAQWWTAKDTKLADFHRFIF